MIRLTYHCPRSGVVREVGPADYSLEVRMEPPEGAIYLKVPTFYASIRCVCGTTHRLPFAAAPQ